MNTGGWGGSSIIQVSNNNRLINLFISVPLRRWLKISIFGLIYYYQVALCYYLQIKNLL